MLLNKDILSYDIDKNIRKEIINMEKKEKEYGLVLAGGGIKGSYQVGVWKALKKIGIKITGE